MSIAQPDGPRLIQHLNVIVIDDVTAYGGGPDWPGPDFVYDPSDVGPPSSWPAEWFNPDGTPSGVPPSTRIAGGPDGSPPKRRKGGTGNPPAPNVLTRADAAPGPRACFAGSIRVVITKPAPDPFGWTGQQPTFTTTVGSCRAYNPPAIPKPATGYILGSPSLIQQVKTFLTTNVGSDSYATILTDSVQGPGVSCSVDADCAGYSAETYAGNGVGVVITAS